MIATRVCLASFHLQLAYPRRDVAARHLRTLGDLIATNSEVRKILSDFSVIGRDILARTASHAAESVRPEHDSLTKVDRPAPSDQFEASGSRQAGSSGTPEGQVRSTSQTADGAQHSEVTEVRAATEYVPVPLSFHRFNRFNSDTIDADAEGDTKKSGLTGRLQNLKASIELDDETPVFSKPLIRMACPILSLKNINQRHAIKWSKVAKSLQRIISPRIDATSSFIALRRYIG